MSPLQFIDAIDRLGLSIAATARLLGVSDRSIRRWASNRDTPFWQPVPERSEPMLLLIHSLQMKGSDAIERINNAKAVAEARETLRPHGPGRPLAGRRP